MDILTTVTPVLVVLILGKLFSVKKILSRDAMNGIKYLVSNVMLPIVIFNALINTTFTGKSIALSLIVYALFTGMMFLGIACKKVFKGHPMGAFLLGGYEGGMFGYPLYIALYGAASLSVFMVIDLGNILFAFTFFIVLINIYNQPDADRKKVLLDSLKSPLVILTAVAIILNVTGAAKWFLSTPVAAVYENTVSVITNPVTAMVLLSVGYDLTFSKKLLKEVGLVCLVRLLLMGVMAVFLLTVCRGLIDSKQMVAAVILMTCLPPQFITPIFVRDGSEREYVSTMISMFSLITVIGFIILTVFI